MKKVSIIVAVYNVEQYLERCLESIVQQSYENIEIIVVNDGSTDYSLEIINRYCKLYNNIKVVNKVNGGLSDARNAGMKKATGEYILFVDGDDWLSVECVEKCSDYLEKEIDIVMFSFLREYGNRTKKIKLFNSSTVIFQDNKSLVRRLVGPTGKEIRNAHRMEDFNPVWNKLYRRELIENILFVDTKKIGTEDLWFNLQVFSRANTIVYLDIEGYHYNKENSMSLTGVYNKQLFVRWQELYQLIKDFIDIYGDDTYNIAFNNRKILNLLALSRNIVSSDLDKKDKIQELDKLLNAPMYEEAFQRFEFKYLSFLWKIFYKLCKEKNSICVYKFLKKAEKLRKWA